MRATEARTALDVATSRLADAVQLVKELVAAREAAVVAAHEAGALAAQYGVPIVVVKSTRDVLDEIAKTTGIQVGSPRPAFALEGMG